MRRHVRLFLPEVERASSHASHLHALVDLSLGAGPRAPSPSPSHRTVGYKSNQVRASIRSCAPDFLPPNHALASPALLLALASAVFFLTAALDALVARGLLRPRTEEQEWLVPLGEAEPRPPTGYIVSFISYHANGFATPGHRFVREVLHYFDVDLHSLTPESFLTMAVFVALCEGYLKIDPDFGLFLFYYKAELTRRQMRMAPFGYCAIHPKHGRMKAYPEAVPTRSNPNWHTGGST